MSWSLLCECVKLLQSCPTLRNPTGCSLPGSSVHGKNTGVGCHALLQETFPTQGSNFTSLPSPALAGGFFTTSATWEARYGAYLDPNIVSVLRSRALDIKAEFEQSAVFLWRLYVSKF